MPTSWSYERAFTLVEVIVASAIGLFVVIGVIMLLGSARDGAERSSMAGDNAAAVKATRHALAADLRAAAPPNLRWPTDWDELRSELRAGSPQLRDVISATPTELVFLADVAGASPGQECIRYAVAGANLERRVYRRTGAGTCAAVPDRTVALLPLEPGVAQVFTYVLLQHPNYESGSGIVNDPAMCARVQLPSAAAPGPLTTLQQTQIVAVRINATATRARRNQSAKDDVNTELGIRGRNTNVYLQALGCAE